MARLPWYLKQQGGLRLSEDGRSAVGDVKVHSLAGIWFRLLHRLGLA